MATKVTYAQVFNIEKAESTARVTRSPTKLSHFLQSNSDVMLQKSFGDRSKVVAFTIYGHLKHRSKMLRGSKMHH